MSTQCGLGHWKIAPINNGGFATPCCRRLCHCLAREGVALQTKKTNVLFVADTFFVRVRWQRLITGLLTVAICGAKT